MNAQIEVHPTGIYRCPNGCEFDELEIGVEGESFMAVIGAPYKRIKCGKCSFLADPAIGKEAAIAKWNETVQAHHDGQPALGESDG